MRALVLVGLLCGCSGSAPDVVDGALPDLAAQLDFAIAPDAAIDQARPVDLARVDLTPSPDLLICVARGATCTASTFCCADVTPPVNALAGSVNAGCDTPGGPNPRCCEYWIEDGPPSCLGGRTRTCMDCGSGPVCGSCV